MTDVSFLVKQAQHGDQDAFMALIRPLERQVYHLILSVLGNRHDAEDAWQETVIKAWQSIRRLRSVDGFKAWFCRIALNEASNINRKRAKQPQLLSEWPDLKYQENDALERYVVVHSYLKELPTEQRAALILRFWLDMTIADIAAATGVPVSTAKTRLYAGMDRVKLMVGEEVDQLADCNY